MSKTIKAVKDDILDFLRNDNTDVGHVLNARAFGHKYITQYRQAQKDALDPALAELVAEGILEKRGEQYHLTEKGAAHIY